VAQYRGIDIDAVIGTQAALYFGQNAIAAGLADEPLTELATSQIQAMIDGAYQTFTSSVAQYRGIDIDAVIGTQAALYFGQNAIAAGLAD
ncbi:S49 family peptidase, partial [Enterobacter hormaechei]|uniref:S49 family peptidase n=1 Tax=Enterobacter hormaechei TaxID=158836 RepID=UPI001F0A3501